jgi:manganese-dependent inorganic pyrophosphatase
MPHTQTPVKVVNDVVGSTSTLISEMFKYSRHKLTPELAGLLMGGVISDTLCLKSPTTTSRDRKIMNWLSKICNIEPEDLTKEFFAAGSIIAKHTPEEILNDDRKEFEGSGFKFAIAQVEEAGFTIFEKNRPELLQQLSQILKESELDFFGLLVTNIITQNSCLLCDGQGVIMQNLTFKKLDDNLYDLPGVLSRKKQLLPDILSVLKNLS